MLALHYYVPYGTDLIQNTKINGAVLMHSRGSLSMPLFNLSSRVWGQPLNLFQNASQDLEGIIIKVTLLLDELS